MKKTGLCTALVLAAGIALAGPVEDFDQASTALQEQLGAGQITELQAAKKMHELAQTLFPHDYQFQSVRNYKVFLASKLESGQIDRTEFDYLWQERRLQYFAEREKAQPQQVQAPAPAPDYATPLLLQSIGNAITRATAAPSTRCTTSPIGNSLSTTCY